jgi:release factor glutamine methyltransferase
MIYAPSDDSFLLAESVRRYAGRNALEIGVGSGIILDALLDRFETVAGTDIDYEALRSYKGSAGLVCCDAASAFAQKARFDLIVSNPPYLPDDRVVDRTVHGGPAGVEATIHFLDSALPLLTQEGKILVITSSLADPAALDAVIASKSLVKKVIKEKKLFFETLSVVELSR